MSADFVNIPLVSEGYSYQTLYRLGCALNVSRWISPGLYLAKGKKKLRGHVAPEEIELRLI